eukprot:SAG31_NODE_5162_length_2706_cov_2.025316_3_plen_174_part_00
MKGNTIYVFFGVAAPLLFVVFGGWQWTGLLERGILQGNSVLETGMKTYGLHFVIKIVLGLAATYVTTAWALERARLDWEEQEFLKAVQISLNYVADEEGDGVSKLCFRTLDECSVDQLMNHNGVGIARIIEAAKQTTWDQPFLRTDSHSLNLIMKAVTNRISSQFASGYIDYE